MNIFAKLISLFKKERINEESPAIVEIDSESEESYESADSTLEEEIEESESTSEKNSESCSEKEEMLEIYIFPRADFSKYSSSLESKKSKLSKEQVRIFKEMKESGKLNICIPTGAGKGFLMMADLLDRIVNYEERIFAIASHRLMLNEQHMDDIVEDLGEMIGDIGFIFVGSSEYKKSKFDSNKEWKRKLLVKNTSYNDLFSSTTDKGEILKKIGEHLSKGRKVVISSTYNSLGRLDQTSIDTIYCDEAHTLASEKKENSEFAKSFRSVKSNSPGMNTYFFTATPKDGTDDETNAFLMNNEDIFGKRTGLSFRECIEAGYVAKPIIHLAYPSEFKKIDIKDYKNMSKFIIETHSSHSEFIKSSSFAPERIDAKILVKCPGVPVMWNIFQELLDIASAENIEILISAGASSKRPGHGHRYFIGEKGYSKNSDYLKALQETPSETPAIVLHVDTMAEGINVSGFTGTEFISADLPTNTKLLQNIGRSTRLHSEDRKNLIDKKIDTKSQNGWIKPFCAVIIPFWDPEGEGNSKEIAKRIRSLRNDLAFDPSFIVSVGSDVSCSAGSSDINFLNKSNNPRLTGIIEEVNNEIEELDNQDRLSDEEMKLAKMDWKSAFEHLDFVPVDKDK